MLYEFFQNRRIKSYEKIQNRKSIQSIFPWMALLEGGVICTKNMVLQKTISFTGKDYLTVDDEEVNHDLAKVNQFLVSLPDGWAFQIDIIREEEANDNLLASSPYLASELIQQERELLYRKYPHFQTKCYLTFLYALTPRKNLAREQFLRGGGSKGESLIDRLLSKEYDDFREKVISYINQLSLILEGTYTLSGEESLAFLHNIISSYRFKKIRCPPDIFGLENILIDCDITVDPLSFESFRKREYLLPITIYDYPRQTYPLFFETLHKLAITYRMSHRYIVYSQEVAEKIVSQQKMKWYHRKSLNFKSPSKADDFVDTVSMGLMQETDAALEGISDGDFSFGIHSGTLILKDENYEKLLDEAREVQKIFSHLGITTKVEELASLDSFLGSLPGNVHAGIRRNVISTRNMVDMIPIHQDWIGEQENKHLKNLVGLGEAQFFCSTRGGNQFRFHLNVGDVGHTLVCGPTGAGKSVLLAFLASTWLKYPKAQVVIFDKDRSAEGITRALGGDFFAVGEEGGLNLQPVSLLFERSPSATQFLFEWIVTIFELKGITLGHKEITDIKNVLSGGLSLKREKHLHLEGIANSFENVNLKSTLRQYAERWKAFIGGDDEITINLPVTTFEMNEVLEKREEIILPVLLYLFHIVERKFTDGRPTLLILDEAWLFLKHRIFSDKLQNWLKTLRKKNVYVILATQEITDFTKSDIKDTILNAVATRIFLPNVRARDAVVAQEYEKVGLTHEEILILSELQQKSEYYFTNTHGHAAISLDLGEIAIQLLTKKSNEYETLSHIRKVLGEKVPLWAKKVIDQFTRR